MNDIQPLNIPKPPDNPEIEEMHKWIQDVYTFLCDQMVNGSALPWFSQNQINQMGGVAQSGKVFMNHDTGKGMLTEAVGGVFSAKTIQTT